jgi:hypothetical protein
MNMIDVSNPARARAEKFREMAVPRSRIYQRDPVIWARERARVELWSKQREIMESVRDNKYTIVKSCHQVGKSFTAALAVCWWLDTHIPGTAFCVTTAPTFAQVRSILWREIGAIHVRASLPGKCNQTEWSMNNQLVAFGRKPSDHNQHGMSGLHAEYMFAVIDEGCGVNKMMYDAISTLVTDANGKQLAIGNPDTTDGEFYNLFKPSSSWNKISISAFDSPNFTGEPVPEKVKKSLISPGWQRDRAEHWGEESALYQSKVLGEFPTIGDPWQVIPLGWANQCRYLELPSGKLPVEAGVDVGAGNDRTVVTIREGMKMTAVYSFVDPDPVKTTGKVARVLREHKVTCAKVDSIGVGWGIYGALKSSSTVHNQTGTGLTHDAEIVPINVGMGPTIDEADLFINRRAQMWWLGRELSRKSLWDFSALTTTQQDQLIHELTMPKYEIVDAKGKVKIEPKDKIIERLKASPDVAESALLCYVPASWAADLTNAQNLIAAPSLLTSTSPLDLFNNTGGSRIGAGGGW